VLAQWTGAGATPPEFQACRSGSRWVWDEVQFDLLDGASCALWVRARPGSALLASEASSAELPSLLATGLAHADWVLVPRHGYASGDVPELRAMLGARFAVISQTATGAAQRTVRRSIEAWQATGAEVLVTGVDGAITTMFGRHGLRLTTGRAAAECSPVSCSACGKSCAPAGP
jgi:beta-lactamase superfamily II metal-dependent hydrolase